ncbi:MAG: hypothetical protein R6V59_00390 [Dehalococcoidia bacterium]
MNNQMRNGTLLRLCRDITAVVILYWSAGEEERGLVEQFGNDHRSYMKRVPRMNIILGITRLWRQPK